jgi:hypothetical protein
MNESSAVFFPSFAEDDIHSDPQRLDAHVIQPEEYEDIPELSELDLEEAVIRRPGCPDQSFRLAPQSPPRG